MISYTPFYITIKKKKITQYQLINDYYVATGTLQRMKKNQNLTLKTIEQLCKVLNCNISDIVTFI